MGDLVDLISWKKKKEYEAHEKKISEVRELRKDLEVYLQEIEDCPIIPKDEKERWAKKMIQLMIGTLDSRKGWPIDSSDM
tara:strand:+ start:505 stop:744 length:240 start_codon:yes stop_codon:yes gene_type:complete